MIVFLTLYLGLISGKQPVALQVDGAVKAVRLSLDGTVVTVLNNPPWRGAIDFGPALQPRELVAAGLNEKGEEIARTSQFVNLPRNVAEIDVVLARDGGGVPASAAIVARHLAHAQSSTATVKLDETVLAVDKDFKAALPAVDMKRPHVLTAEMRFADDTVARREVVFGGHFSETVSAQLTPVAVVRTGKPDSDAPPPDGCFVSGGVPLHVKSIEKAAAQVILIRDPDPKEVRAQLQKSVTKSVGAPQMGEALRARDRDMTVQLLSPLARHVGAAEEPATILFPVSPAYHADIAYVLRNAHAEDDKKAPRQWADAVAVAGVRAAASGHRRVVVLVLGGAADRSGYDPVTVRAYLASLGVPLLVWSVSGAHRELAGAWGPMLAITAKENLAEATGQVRRALDEQRIAWIDADPLTALRAEIKDGCGYARIAR